MGFVCEFGKEGREEVWKKGMSKWKKYMTIEGEVFVGLIFLHNTKLSSYGELKNCIEWEFLRVYMNSSNLIDFVIIFLKLKI
jgi:hypothetical protein